MVMRLTKSRLYSFVIVEREYYHIATGERVARSISERQSRLVPLEDPRPGLGQQGSEIFAGSRRSRTSSNVECPSHTCEM